MHPDDIPSGIDKKRAVDISTCGMALRCHPENGTEGPWNDWITISNQGILMDPDSILRGIPAKIHCFATWNTDANKETQPVVVVHQAIELVDSTVLVEKWKLWYTLDTDTGHISPNARFWLSKITVRHTDEIMQRIFAFTETRNVIDLFEDELLPYRKIAIIVKDKERWWGSEFTTT